MSAKQHTELTLEEIEQVERELLDDFHRQVAPAAEGDAAAMIIGVYPETVIRVVATAQGESRSHDWSIWDGSVTGSPLRPSGVAEFLQTLELRIIEWLGAEYWRWPS
jgi:hypothetical protein